MSGDTYPVAKSLADNVCRLFLGSPAGTRLTEIVIAERFNVRSSEVAPFLAGAVQHAWLARDRGRVGDVVMWTYKAGPALVAMAQAAAKTANEPAHAAPPSAPAPAPAAVAKPSHRLGQRGKRLPPLDIATVQVSYDVPVPARKHKPKNKGTSQYTPLFQRLDKVGASAPAPLAYKAALTKAAMVFAKHHAPAAKFSVRPDERDATLCRVHRVA